MKDWLDLALMELSDAAAEISLGFGEVADAALRAHLALVRYRNAIYAERLAVWRPWR